MNLRVFSDFEKGKSEELGGKCSLEKGENKLNKLSPLIGLEPTHVVIRACPSRLTKESYITLIA